MQANVKAMLSYVLCIWQFSLILISQEMISRLLCRNTSKERASFNSCCLKLCPEFLPAYFFRLLYYKRIAQIAEVRRMNGKLKYIRVFFKIIIEEFKIILPCFCYPISFF